MDANASILIHCNIVFTAMIANNISCKQEFVDSEVTNSNDETNILSKNFSVTYTEIEINFVQFAFSLEIYFDSTCMNLLSKTY